MSLLHDAHALAPDLTALRHALHREPELGLDLPRTQAKVLAALEGLGLEITLGTALSSVTAVLRGGRPGPAVLLRGDMDALPVQEETGLPYASVLDGRMHACGHDLHTTGLVGAARLLAARREELAGDVVFMFQPGEEGQGGAKIMIDEGVLDAAGERVVAAYALHVVSTGAPTGFAATRPGPMLAASDAVHVTVHGRGGHGSSPHSATDPVPAMCAMVTALQTLVTREIDIFDPAVVTYEELLKLFWESHNPTQGFRQGNDVGTQYRSAVYTHSPAQAAAADASREAYQKVLTASGHKEITTEILPAEGRPFWPAEAYHQQYLDKNPGGYCGIGGTGVSCPIGVAPAEG
ncbi:peptide-methionine (S)-S-oxide reductase MsrA [Streptomyces albovinaceus]|uniref:peptide-methionine (S)-S-oxide reductase MsrA n=1 Tax=Streptomyces albovinaceus TaxID=66867 RepID=UPI000A36A5F4|nr:peptide-methionine (S)-S-oxide reductase MsrA [Streptomyces albovinaceus]